MIFSRRNGFGDQSHDIKWEWSTFNKANVCNFWVQICLNFEKKIKKILGLFSNNSRLMQGIISRYIQKIETSSKLHSKTIIFPRILLKFEFQIIDRGAIWTL
ncbi:hypothetical protein CH370_19770 [Leptospira kmetyi]|uniref:Uncharacterized protein n=1 Tax=Leptospira kmetyi TaxID=408139 RepID=A0ABX4N6U4_9LEPT|nr:hypothetical protein CH378_14315 [Leptospira kmetyi]PJZ39695.1 hypothetical protein CH370_19770 [Leptospira kmetyi]